MGVEGFQPEGPAERKPRHRHGPAALLGRPLAGLVPWVTTTPGDVERLGGGQLHAPASTVTSRTGGSSTQGAYATYS